MSPLPLLLAADVGGTHCRLALFQGRALLRQATLSTRGPGLEPLLPGFLEGLRPAAACLAVAGPVLDGRVRFTNGHWVLHEAELAAALACPVRLVNDFVAAARGVPELDPGGLRALQAGQPDPGAPVVVLGPGTGLGQALLLPGPGGWRVLASQGGHVGFAPTDAEEDALASWLRGRLGRVSFEDLLSGAGLLNLHDFYLSRGLDGAPLRAPAEVSASASPAARAARRRFLHVLGARAGDAALACLAFGGVVICGGIPPRLDPRPEELLPAFLDKGRMADLMKRFPLSMVTDPLLGLRGAAALAGADLGGDGMEPPR